MSDRLLLLLAAVGLGPIALSYGVVPSLSVSHLLGFSVDGINHTHVFRGIMGLYLANICFWLAGSAFRSVRLPALWGLFIFMSGLASGRILSLVIDGFPGFVLTFYLLAEIVFAVMALIAIRKFV